MPYRITLMLEQINVPPVGQTEPTESANAQEQTAQPHQHPEDEAAATASKDPLDKEQDADSSEFYLLAYAVPITSAYKGPEEKNPNGQFGLRHSSIWAAYRTSAICRRICSALRLWTFTIRTTYQS